MRKFGRNLASLSPLYILATFVFVGGVCVLTLFSSQVWSLFNPALKGVRVSIDESVRGFHALTRTVSDLVFLFQNNKRLENENKELHRLLATKLSIQEQEKTSQLFADTYAHLKAPSIPGRMSLLHDPSLFNHLTLYLGSQNGLKIGDAVVNRYGLLGRVIEVKEKVSRVLLLTDFSSRVPVLVGDALEEAILCGGGTEVPFLVFKDNHFKASKGDIILTSGTGGLVEKGIPVGVIDKISDKMYVNLFAQPEQAREVRVFLNKGDAKPS